MKIVISQFCQSRDASRYQGELASLIPEITKKIESGTTKPGYRSGVILVDVAPIGFLGSVRTLQEGDQFRGTFKARAKGEDPRKEIRGDAKELPADPVQAVDAVLYSQETLAEKNENSDPDADWEVITFLPKIELGPQPMPPETLMANHFGISGGTDTKMSPEEFERELRKSFLFWKDKLIVE